MYKVEEEAVSRRNGVCDGGRFWIQRSWKSQGLLKQPPSQPLQSTSGQAFFSTFLKTHPWLTRLGGRLALQTSQSSKHIVGCSLSRLSRAEAAGIEPAFTSHWFSCPATRSSTSYISQFLFQFLFLFLFLFIYLGVLIKSFLERFSS